MANPKNKSKVMLDSNVIISGVTCPRHCFEILKHAFKQDFVLFLSEIILEETTRNIKKKFLPYLPVFKDFLLKCPFELVSSPKKDAVFKNIGLVRDESDIPVILCAIKAKVDFFVTGDKDFIDEAMRTKKHLSCLAPTAFLQEVIGWGKEELEAVRLRTWKDIE